MQFAVNGMTCSHCARTVTDAILSVDPASQVEVDLAGRRVSIRSKAPATALTAAIAAAGYEVVGQSAWDAGMSDSRTAAVRSDRPKAGSAKK